MKKSLILSIVLGSLLAGNAALGQATPISSLSGVVSGPNDTWNITGTTTIGVNQEIWIDKPTFVTGGGHLVINEGAVLRFTPPAGAEPGYLCVSSDGTIDAVGTSTNPIIFTTAAAPDGSIQTNVNGPWWDATPKTAPMPILDSTDVNLWGGFIILGNAPINTGDVDVDSNGFSRPGYAKIEGVATAENTPRVYYGGEKPNDNSGRVRYVSIRYSGQSNVEGDEIQGLTLGGVGAGTELEYIEVFGSGDDGIEVFGGSASFKYMVLSYFDDDGFDLDQGYVGNAQFGLVIANPTQSINADNLFEMDGDDDILDDENNVSLDGRPITYAQIANFTLIGWDDSDHGMQLRQGFGGDIYNTIVANIIGDTGLRIDSSGTANAAAAGYPDVNSQARVNAGTLNLISTSWYGVTTPNHRQIDLDVLNNNAAVAPGSKNNVIGPLSAASFGNNGAFGDVLQKGNPINPVPFSTAVNQNVANPGNNFFEVVNYRGAFERNPTKLLWTSNWTALNKLGELVSRGNGQN